MHSTIELLGNIDFLAGSSEDLLARIARDVQEIELPEGREIFAEGALGDEMYFIVDGTVQLVKEGRKLLSLEHGDYIGEMALIDDEPRSAGAVAATDVVLLRWLKDDFLASIRTSGEVAYQVCRSLSAKIRHNVERVAHFQGDLQRAAEVQRALLPAPTFENSMIDLAAFCLQADNVGGDYYDYIVFGDDRIGLVVADVQGHGFYAALLVAMLKTSLHGQAARDPDPGTLMGAANRAILEDLSEILTATCCCVLLDRRSRTLRFCSAGHLPQYHYRAATGELHRLESGNLLLGLPGCEDLVFESEQREWAPGDLLVLFTDGLTEAEDPQEEQFGDGRVQALISRHQAEAPGAIVDQLREALDAHRGDTPLADDVTIVVARLA